MAIHSAANRPACAVGIPCRSCRQTITPAGSTSLVGLASLPTPIPAAPCCCRVRPGPAHAGQRPAGGLLHGRGETPVSHPREDEEESVGQHRGRCAGWAAGVPRREGGRHPQVGAGQGGGCGCRPGWGGGADVGCWRSAGWGAGQERWRWAAALGSSRRMWGCWGWRPPLAFCRGTGVDVSVAAGLLDGCATARESLFGLCLCLCPPPLPTSPWTWPTRRAGSGPPPSP